MAESRGVAILVGAGDAIGAAVARRFAKGGYTVCICRRDASKSQGLVGELRAAGHNIHAFSVDARQEAEVQGIFAAHLTFFFRTRQSLILRSRFTMSEGTVFMPYPRWHMLNTVVYNAPHSRYD